MDFKFDGDHNNNKENNDNTGFIINDAEQFDINEILNENDIDYNYINDEIFDNYDDNGNNIDLNDDINNYNKTNLDGPEDKKLNNSKITTKRFKRKHHKSKNGCSACKERRIKCDQRIPICSNCERKGIKCPYLMMTPYQIHRLTEDEKYKNEIDLDKEKNRFNKYSNSNSKKNRYTYNISGLISLNNNVLQTKESIYQSHEMEIAMLSSTLNDKIKTNNELIEVADYIPLRTNYIPIQDGENLLNNDINKNNNNLTKEMIPLHSNSRISNKIFNSTNYYSIKYLDGIVSKYTLAMRLLTSNNFKSLRELYNGMPLDVVLFLNYVNTLNLSQLFNKLLRKSLLLFANDYYKNIILKQQILPFSNYMAKLSISCECENESVVSIDEITQIIKKEYLPYFDEVSRWSKDLFLGSFQILDDCLGYHFKNGLKYDMDFEDGKNSIKLVGIFSTGIYATLMARAKENDLMTSTNIISLYLILTFKEFLIINYNIKLFEDFKNVIDKLLPYYNNDINYENLKLFCEKHYKLLLINQQKDSLLGYDNGYLIRLVNSYRSILPFDISNLMYQDNSNFKLSETEIVVRLAYYTLNQIIRALIPGHRNITAGFFSGNEWTIFNINNFKSLMETFKKIKNKKLQLAGIFLIRTGFFLKCHLTSCRDYFVNFQIDSLLNYVNDDEISIHQRYLKLKKIKDDGFMDEIQVKSFLLERGNFFQKWNYPNPYKLKPKRGYRISDHKISNYFKNNEDLMIEDFINNNNGFFSQDVNLLDTVKTVSIEGNTTFVNKDQTKILWTLITYIRINNL